MEMEENGIPELVKPINGDEQHSMVEGIGSKFETKIGLPKPKIPVTILTGFLGAGKSTLLRRLLQERHGWKVAVLLNELGPSGGVDRAQIQSQLQFQLDYQPSSQQAPNPTEATSVTWMEVENGCLCCTAKNETFLALEALLRRRSDIQHVVIEASGAADPSQLVQKLWVDEALESTVYLDAVICVVDASRLARGKVKDNLLDQGGPGFVEIARQIAIADVILLNKTDLISRPEGLQACQEILENINPIAKILATQYSNVSLDQIFYLLSYSCHPIKNLASPTQAHITEDRISQLLERACRITSGSHSEEQTIRSISLFFSEPILLAQFERKLFTLLWERHIDYIIDGRQERFVVPKEDHLLRIKGLVQLQAYNEGPIRTYYLQAVEEKYELEPLTGGVLRDTSCQYALVFIGVISLATERAITTHLFAPLYMNKKND